MRAHSASAKRPALPALSLKNSQTRSLAKNKKAFFDYEVLEKFETGIILTGPEVKSIKAGSVQLKGSFAVVVGSRVFLENMHVSPYRYSVLEGYNPLRKRELLLHRKEIEHLSGIYVQKGGTLIPLEIILKNNLIKVLLGVCRGKKSHDKRNVLKKRAVERDINPELSSPL